MTPTTILHEAEVELWDAVVYCESRSAGLGLDFQAEIAATVAVSGQSPERWPVRADGTRRCLTQRFPCLVVYLLLPGHIWIIAFAHCRRRPRYWSARIGKAQPRHGPHR
jgi:hypothetical protein